MIGPACWPKSKTLSRPSATVLAHAAGRSKSTCAFKPFSGKPNFSEPCALSSLACSYLFAVHLAHSVAVQVQVPSRWLLPHCPSSASLACVVYFWPAFALFTYDWSCCRRAQLNFAARPLSKHLISILSVALVLRSAWKANPVHHAGTAMFSLCTVWFNE